MSREEIELEFDEIIEGFAPIVNFVENKFVEHQKELTLMKHSASN